MKKIISLLMIVTAFSFTGKTQTNINDVKDFCFYGVDFSLAKVMGANEMSSHIKQGLCSINALIYKEQKKYDFNKLIKKRAIAYNFDFTNKSNEDIAEENLTTSSDKNDISSKSIQQIISSLSKGKTGTGMVFIAELLNKKSDKGTYHVIFFDESTKEIIYSKRVAGKAGGSGIRNYWAGSIYNILKTWKY